MPGYPYAYHGWHLDYNKPIRNPPCDNIFGLDFPSFIVKFSIY